MKLCFESYEKYNAIINIMEADQPIFLKLRTLATWATITLLEYNPIESKMKMENDSIMMVIHVLHGL